MRIKTLKKLLSQEELLKLIPLSKVGQKRIAKDREDICKILTGEDKRKLVIIGPCSAWPKEAVLEYAQRLKKLEIQLQNKIKIVMRVYTQKPRTTKGWTGPVNQSNPFLPPDIEEGIKYTRSMMIKIIEMGLPIADEALFTHNTKGFFDLLSWVAIGARSVEDQEHRIFASAMDCPVGMKNPTSGLIEIGVNAIVAAQHPHVAVFNGYQVETLGNPFAHLVLRGGSSGSNYSLKHLKLTKKLVEKQKIINPAVIIDASHDNSLLTGRREHLQQLKVVDDVVRTIKKDSDLNYLVKGFMFESFIKSGNQKLDSLTKETIDLGGLSITDSCLSWKDTENYLLKLAKML